MRYEIRPASMETFYLTCPSERLLLYKKRLDKRKRRSSMAHKVYIVIDFVEIFRMRRK